MFEIEKKDKPVRRTNLSGQIRNTLFVRRTSDFLNFTTSLSFFLSFYDFWTNQEHSNDLNFVRCLFDVRCLVFDVCDGLIGRASRP